MFFNLVVIVAICHIIQATIVKVVAFLVLNCELYYAIQFCFIVICFLSHKPLDELSKNLIITGHVKFPTNVWSRRDSRLQPQLRNLCKHKIVSNTVILSNTELKFGVAKHNLF